MYFLCVHSVRFFRNIFYKINPNIYSLKLRSRWTRFSTFDNHIIRYLYERVYVEVKFTAFETPKLVCGIISLYYNATIAAITVIQTLWWRIVWLSDLINSRRNFRLQLNENNCWNVRVIVWSLTMFGIQRLWWRVYIIWKCCTPGSLL